MPIAEKVAVQQHELEAFVAELTKAAGNNLVCVTLYGSAVSQEFHAGFSDLNLLCVVKELSAAAMQALAPALRSWKLSPPLFFTRQEIADAAGVFPIEMMDIRDQHHVLYGEDVFKNLNIPLDRHKVQLEHDLRTKLLFLRQHYIASPSDVKRIQLLMLDSVANFIVLFRHCLLVMGQTAPKARREVVEQLAHKITFDPSPFLQLLQIREGKALPETLSVQDVFPRYLQGIEGVIRALKA